jgi:hypothetical protein
MPIDFDGTNDSVDLGLSLPFLNGAAAATLTAWIRTARTTGAVQRILSLAIGPPPGTSNSTRLGFMTDLTAASTIGRTLDANSPTTVTAGTTIVANVWAHIAVTFVGSTRLATLFINGVSVGSGTFTNSTAGPFSATNCKNGFIAAGADGTLNFFEGDIENAEVYSRELSANEILTKYTSRGHDEIAFGRQGRWRMSEGAPGVAVAANGVINIGGTGAATANPVGGPLYTTGALAPRRRAA